MKIIDKASKTVLAGGAVVTLGFLVYFFSPLSTVSPFFADANSKIYDTSYVVPAAVTLSTPTLVVTHVKTPAQVKAIYMSSWVAGSKELRDKLVKLIDDTELNSLVLDIKDYTGRIAFEVDNPKLKEFGSVEKRIPDIKEFIDELHKKNIYVIGRISSFQDSYLVKTHPEWAVKNKAGAVWKDYKGVSWMDAGAKPVWDYLSLIGDEAYAFGFDELNFDYIRFPSDGNMKDIYFTYSEGKQKADVLKGFFAYLDETFHPKGITISADLFGLTTSSRDDLGIGQNLENALAHFDYVAPMVYPSHYPTGFLGFKTPAEKPYEVMHFALEKAVERANAATTTPLKIRPWIQDFEIGHTPYTPEMIRAEFKATYDVGLNSWMIWNAANRYTAAALDTVPIAKTQ